MYDKNFEVKKSIDRLKEVYKLLEKSSTRDEAVEYLVKKQIYQKKIVLMLMRY